MAPMDMEKFHAAIWELEAWLNSDGIGRKNLLIVSEIEKHIRTLRDIAPPNVRARITNLSSRARSLFDGSRLTDQERSKLRKEARECLDAIENDGAIFEAATEN